MNKPDKNQENPDSSAPASHPVIHDDDDDAQMDGPDYADIFSKPPTVALTHLVLGMVIQLFFRLGPGLLGSIVWILPGVVLILAGLKIAMTAMKEFSHHETTVPTDEPAAALVRSGVFARSRNPIYIGLCLLYLGIGMVLGNGWVVLLFLPFFAYLNNHVIPREEDYLTRKFGAAYKAYCKDVGRWF